MANYLNSQKSSEKTKAAAVSAEGADKKQSCACGCFDLIYVDVTLNDDPPNYSKNIMKICTKTVCAQCGKVYAYHGWHSTLAPHSNDLKTWKELIAANPRVNTFSCYFFAKKEEHPDLKFRKGERLSEYNERVYGGKPW
ncbi:hypothetical protein AAIR98_001444 [Elusimicrobium simillimum]|uniref:hypothetical protein n=1 Tax=Elusimicrobium simillimum TaxID=3143438 RepID=UPI003C6FA80B